MSKFAYLVELSTLQFDEIANNPDTNESWIMAMPIGKYKHPQYGNIDITPQRVLKFANNVNTGIRGQQLDIDYDHKEYSGEAAGWVKRADARPDGLWILVEWTKKAYEAIKSKAYRYFSPEFDDAWKDPRTGETYKDVLFGGGITNRPFLKGIQPLNLSEFYSEKDSKENENMDPELLKELAASLGLAEDADSKTVFGTIVSKLSELATAQAKLSEKPADEQNPANEDNSEKVELSDLMNHPTVKKMAETLEAQSNTLNKMIIDSKVKKFTEDAEANGKLVPATTVNDLTKLLSEAPSETYSDMIVKTFSDALASAGPASGEKGGQRKLLKDQESDSTKKFDEKVKAKMASDKISYADAAVLVAGEDSELFNEHRTESYLKEGE